VNKLAEHGSFIGTRTSFCSLTQMVPIDLILDAFERLSGSGMTGDAGAASDAIPSRFEHEARLPMTGLPIL